MRTPIALGVALWLTGCVSAISDPDDGSGAGPGGGTNDGTGARVEVSVDKTTLSTELKTANQVVVTVRSVNRFSGQVHLAAQVVDGADTPFAGWTATLDKQTIDLAAGASATVNATVTIPTKNTGLSAQLKIEATSSAPIARAFSVLTVTNQVTFAIAVTGGQCTYPSTYGKSSTPDTISVGTKVRWYNAGTTDFVIHIDNGDAFGFTNQAASGDPVTEPNTAYEQTADAESNTALVQWYCETPLEANITGNSGYFNTKELTL